MTHSQGTGGTRWLVRVRDVETSPESVLHAHEYALWKAKCSERRSEFLHGRSTLKCLIAPPERHTEILIAPDSRGKPHLPSMPQMNCSISHTAEFAAAAISPRDVGIDVERIRPRHASLLRDISREDVLGTLPNLYGPLVLPTVIWSIKEAVAKADDRIFPFATYLISAGEKIIVNRDSRKWVVTLCDLPSHICALAEAR